MEFSSQDSGQKKLLRCIEVLLNKSLLRPTIIVMPASLLGSMTSAELPRKHQKGDAIGSCGGDRG
ncbi:hypothetical protein NC653_032552 [Populus alba x Populus x berolinensis]|uniref:Uncharacterized protein n=1 Tax=Populus alba x Populus x berolinensis TaxID=444605 RepID=A0AAD6PZ92_9ROSI|nr:hypothetical protein NC653_032552 [Populus alba x Populus x berolinensis]